jgi:hypothetical protein
MNKMEITNHGRGLALTMGLASMHVCVLLGFVEGLCDEIDGFNVCVLLEFIERLYVVIDGFQCVCSAGILLKDYLLKLMVSMCVFLLELSDSVYAGVVTTCVVCACQNVCCAAKL